MCASVSPLLFLYQMIKKTRFLHCQMVLVEWDFYTYFSFFKTFEKVEIFKKMESILKIREKQKFRK